MNFARASCTALHNKIEFESIWPVHKIPIQVCVAPL